MKTGYVYSSQVPKHLMCYKKSEYATLATRPLQESSTSKKTYPILNEWKRFFWEHERIFHIQDFLYTHYKRTHFPFFYPEYINTDLFQHAFHAGQFSPVACNI